MSYERPLSEIERTIASAVERGTSFSLASLGGEETVLGDAGLPRSPWMPEIVSMASQEWQSLKAPRRWRAFFAGSLLNPDRTVMSATVSQLAVAPSADYGDYVDALENHVRDGSASELLRVEAAAGIMRFALLDRRWKSAALSALVRLDRLTNPFAGAMFCRLASLAYEQFRETDAIGWLQAKASDPNTMSEAAFELGVLSLAGALERNTLPDISAGLSEASMWFDRSINGNEDRRDAKIYSLLVHALLPLTDPQRPISTSLAEDLRKEAFSSARWDRTVAGHEWLKPSAAAYLEWIPLVDNVVHVSSDLRKHSWLDAAKALERVLRVYRDERSVRPGLADLSHAVRPAIEARFVQERGLLTHLDDWLSAMEGGHINHADAARLRANIERLGDPGPDGGKAPGAASTSPTSSSAKRRLV